MESNTPSASPEVSPAVKSLLPFDILRVGARVLGGWLWIGLAAAAGGAGLGYLGWAKAKTKYTLEVQIVRREVQNTFQMSEMGESFKPRQFNAATVTAMMRSGSLLEKTGQQIQPPISASELQSRLIIRPEKNTDLITVIYTADDSAEKAAEAVNQYGNNVAELTKDLQAQEAKELLTFINDQLERTERELTKAQAEQMAFSKESGLYNADKETESYLKQIGDLDLKIETARITAEGIDFRLRQVEPELAKQNPGMQRLKDARDKLAESLTQYTEQHPIVIEQQARVKVLEEKVLKEASNPSTSFQSTGNTVANSLYLDTISLTAQKQSLKTEIQTLSDFREHLRKKLETIPDKAQAQAGIKSRIFSLQTTRDLLSGRQREAQLYAERALGYYRLFSPATPGSAEISSRTKKGIIFGLAGAILLGGAVVALLALKGALDDRILSPSDLRRLTKSPVIAALPNEEKMDEDAMERWRFSTWAQLVRTVPAAGDGALVVGVLSAMAGEGKSTWMRQLGRAALERGLKAMAVSLVTGDELPPGVVPLEKALAKPERVLNHLQKARPAAVELAVPADFVWTADVRAKWREALAVWIHEPELVVLVELPPATRLDSLLLAETLPAVLWLSDSGRLRREQVTGILETLQRSGLKLAGALLNRIPPMFQKLPDLARFGLCLAGGLLLSLNPVQAQDTDFNDPGAPPSSAANADLLPISPTDSVVPGGDSSFPGDPALLPAPGEIQDDPLTEPVPPRPRPALPAPANPQLAGWQERLVLGPGDLVNLQVYGRKEYTRTQVPVGPDGSITYLQVHGFKAAGLTIDELREGLTTALRSFIRTAQVIVTPSAWRSKKYFLMGTIIDRGAYALDRPMTLLEAAARARGIATGLMEQNTVEIADMGRAFVVREGKKLPIDFAKLFYEGDLSQNVQLQPGDYIYFPSNVVNECYILGAVGSPGGIGVTEGLTAMGAITVRGGFDAGAWPKKVLVIRGSLDAPEIHILDGNAILSGKQKDMLLQPRDLVYVSTRPWKRAEEILDLAVKAFVQTGTATWTGKNIGPLIKKPLLPSLNSP